MAQSINVLWTPEDHSLSVFVSNNLLSDRIPGIALNMLGFLVDVILSVFITTTVKNIINRAVSSQSYFFIEQLCVNQSKLKLGRQIRNFKLVNSPFIQTFKIFNWNIRRAGYNYLLRIQSMTIYSSFIQCWACIFYFDDV